MDNDNYNDHNVNKENSNENGKEEKQNEHEVENNDKINNNNNNNKTESIKEGEQPIQESEKNKTTTNNDIQIITNNNNNNNNNKSNTNSNATQINKNESKSQTIPSSKPISNKHSTHPSNPKTPLQQTNPTLTTSPSPSPSPPFPSPTIINHLPKNPIPSQPLHIKTFFIYQNTSFTLFLPSKTSLHHIKTLLSTKLNLPLSKFTLIFNNKILSDLELTKQLHSFTTPKQHPIFLIKKTIRSFDEYEHITSIYQRKYNFKVLITNFPIKEYEKLAIASLVEKFFSDLMLNADYYIDYDYSNGYYVCFNSCDLAFDFQRFMRLIRVSVDCFKECKCKLVVNKCNVKEMHKSVSVCKGRKEKGKMVFDTNLVCVNSRYMSDEERRRREDNEGKKKWVDKRDFIRSVGKYSGIII